MVAVGREDDPHPVPRVELVDARAARALLEGGVAEDLPRVAGGGDDDELALADPEQHERPVAQGEVAHGAVWELAQEVVQAADDQQLPWSGGQPRAWLLAACDGMDEQSKEEAAEGAVVIIVV